MQVKYQIAGCGSRAGEGAAASASAEVVAGFSPSARPFRLQPFRQPPKSQRSLQPLLALRLEAFKGRRFEEAAWLALALSGLAMTALGLWSAR